MRSVGRLLLSFILYCLSCATFAGIPASGDTAASNPLDRLVWRAVKQGDHPYLQELIDCGALIQIRDKEGLTPLLWAAQAGHLPMTSFLLTRNAPIDSRDNQGQTALMRAAAAGAFPMVLFLHQRGADLKLVDAHNRTAHELAVTT